MTWCQSISYLRARLKQTTLPVVVINNDQANAFAPVMVVPLTSNLTKVYPVELFLSAARSGLDRDSKAQVETVATRDAGTYSENAEPASR